jgi:uncharacterized membrane protein
MSIWLALVVITLCAVLWDASVVLQKLAVDELPRIRFDRSLPYALASLLKSGRWTGGLAASALGWGLFAWALVYTPVSVARAIQGSGFVVLAAFSLLFLGHRLAAGEWIGVALVAAGILALGLSEGSTARAQAQLSLARLVPGAAVCVVACAAAYALPARLRVPIPWAVAFSAIAGILLGLGDVSTKLLIDLVQRRGIGMPAAGAGLFLVATYVSGFLVLSRSYQHGRAILVTAVSDLASRLVAIGLGIASLGESLPGEPRERALAIAGYTSIIAGVILLSRFSGEGVAAGLASARGGSKRLGHAVEAEGPAPPEPDAKV